MNFGIIWDVNIGTISNRYCERMWFPQWQYYINLILIFLPTNYYFGDENNIYLIFYFYTFLSGIDNCFFAFDTRNTPKFEPFHIEHQPTQIR